MNQSEGPSLSETLYYAIQIVVAPEKAYKAGVIDGDLKPTNTIVSDCGLVKVLGCCLAKLTHPVDEAVPGATESVIEHKPA